MNQRVESSTIIGVDAPGRLNTGGAVVAGELSLSGQGAHAAVQPVRLSLLIDAVMVRWSRRTCVCA